MEYGNLVAAVIRGGIAGEGERYIEDVCCVQWCELVGVEPAAVWREYWRERGSVIPPYNPTTECRFSESESNIAT